METETVLLSYRAHPFHQERAGTTSDNPRQEPNAAAVPLIDIGTTNEGGGGFFAPPTQTSRALVSAFRDSGFAIVRSPLLTKDLQTRALAAAASFLAAKHRSSGGGDKTKELAAAAAAAAADSPPLLVEAIEHPTDPKIYSMLDCDDQYDFVSPDHTLKDYAEVLRSIQTDIFRHIAVGLGMSDFDFLARLHNEHNDALRLITYHPGSEDTGNRCKEHSDYGTITLLSTDGVSGLELFHHGKWLPVPFVEGALVVNVGSLLSGWTRGSLKATLHRVAGPASLHSGSDPGALREAVHRPRTSLAFFADPNKGVSVSESLEAATADSGNGRALSVEDYISWRSGGDGTERSGVSFTEDETKRIHNKTL